MQKTTTLLLLLILTSVNAQFFEGFENGVPGKMEQIYSKGQTTWIDFGLSAINVDKPLSDANSAVFFNGMSTKEEVTYLQTPILDLSKPKLSLDFLYLQKLKTNGYSNELIIEISSDAGSTWKEIANYNQTNDDVVRIHIDLENYKLSTSSNVRFKSIQTSPLDGFPIVIDDIRIAENNNNNKFSDLESKLSQSETMIYPNPSNGIITVETKQLIKLTIFDCNGRTVYNKSDLLNVTNIDLSQLSKGIYFAKINSTNFQELKKIIIQ